MADPFIGLEDEITLRRSVRAVFKHEGVQGIFQVLGELARSMQIVIETFRDIVDEEENRGGNSNDNTK
jgi:hypothetical protein